MKDYKMFKDFSVEEHIEHIVNWIKEYFINNGQNSKVIIGISGGKDSTICAALCVKALGKDRVIGVLMPNGTQNSVQDMEDSLKVCEILGIEHYYINIGETFTSLCDEIDVSGICKEGYDTSENPMIKTNLPSRLRMATLYSIAAMVGGRVCCTSNASERYISYFTKWGDNAGDFAPIANYTVSELLAIGEVLHQRMGIPNHLIYKTPSDGMCGKTDEENIGFTYKELDDFILFNKIPEEFEVYKSIINRHKASLHKTLPINMCHKPKDEIYF